MNAYTELPAYKTGSTEWLQQRNTGLGSSDCSAIFGLSNYESPYSLWQLKTGRAPLNPPVDERTQELRDMGNAMEPVIRDLTAKRLGVEISKDELALASVERPWQHYNPDGLTPDGALFEAKNVSWFKKDEWIGQISDHAELQVHHGAAVTGATHAIVSALIGGNQLVVQTIEINPRVVEMIIEQETEFWGYVVRDEEPPLDSHVRTLEALTKEWRHHGGVVEAQEQDVLPLLIEYADAKRAEKDAANRKRKVQASIAAMLNGHDVLTDGKRVLARAQRTAFSARRFQAEHPDMWADYQTSTTKFDLERFKTEQPDMYRAFQGVAIRPSTIGDE